MPAHNETTLAIHGLSVDAGIVRADVFSIKLKALLDALKTSDTLANGRGAHDYLLPSLSVGSAVVTVRARARKRKSAQSPISYFQRAATAVYDGNSQAISSLDPKIFKKIEKLTEGANEKFAHGEISFSDDNVVRIDDYLQRQAADALNAPHLILVDRHPTMYKGAAFATFDGMLKEIDSRGTMLRGKLVLEPGTTEIDCVMNKTRVPDARHGFDKRVVIKGIARYDGRSNLPARVDVYEITQIKPDADLTRWKGAFVFREIGDIEDF